MKLLKNLLLFLVVAFLAACSAEADGEGEESQVFSLYATDSSSSYYGYNVGIANAISTIHPELQVTVVETGGSSDNMQRLYQGEGNFALGTSPGDYQSYFGEGDYKEQKNENIRALWYFVPSPFNFVVSKESGVEGFSDLNGKDFSFGGSGTSTEKVTTDVFNILGVTPKSFAGSMSDAQDAFADRRIAGLTKTGTPPDSYVQKAVAELDINILSMTDEEIKSIREKLPYISENIIPAGSYDGIEEDIKTIQFTMSILLDSSVSQEVGYKMWDAMWSDKGKEIWLNSFSAANDVNIPELTLESAIPLHAGAVQYLKEHGFDVPEELIPPEYEEVN